MMCAAWKGHDTVIPLLLEADAQIDAQDNGGWTALTNASYIGKEAAVRELLKGNPNLDLKDSDGKTALDYARQIKHQSIVNLLVEYHEQRTILLTMTRQWRPPTTARLKPKENG